MFGSNGFIYIYCSFDPLYIYSVVPVSCLALTKGHYLPGYPNSQYSTDIFVLVAAEKPCVIFQIIVFKPTVNSTNIRNF